MNEGFPLTKNSLPFNVQKVNFEKYQVNRKTVYILTEDCSSALSPGLGPSVGLGIRPRLFCIVMVFDDEE